MGQAQRCASPCLPSLCPGMAGPELPELCAPNSLRGTGSRERLGLLPPYRFCLYPKGPNARFAQDIQSTAKSEKVTTEQEKIFLNGNILNVPKYTILSILSVILGIPNL